MVKRLEGKAAIITGGGAGIGAAAARLFAAEGAAVMLVDTGVGALDKTAGAIGKMPGARVATFVADVSDEAKAGDAVKRALAAFGRLDVLVNNAGTTRFIPPTDLDALTDEVWDEVLDVNLKGTFYCSRASAPALKRAGGAIVNVASIAGVRASGSSIVYGVSKAAVLQLTRNLALALAPEVRVNAVAPGMVSTRWFRTSLGDEIAASQEERVASGTPLGHVATADHVAQAVLALLAADHVSGETLIVDGGRHVTY
jgi:3-oxoacyl-[acyl-carrier protein] reductase